MKRTFAIVGGLLLVLVLVAGVGIYYLLTNLNAIIEAAVEDYGSEVTRTDVSLSQADIDIASGQGALRGLTVGNPSGFKTDHAFSLGEVSVVLNSATVTEDVIVIKRLKILAPEVTLELNEQGGNNLDTIKKNVAGYGGGKGGDKKDSGGGSGGSGETTQKKLIIEDLLISDAKVNVSAALLKGETASAPIPTIHLKNIGKSKGGVPPEKVAAEIISTLTASARKAVAKLKIKSLSSALKLPGGIEKSLGDEALDVIEEGAKEAEGALKSLFGD